MQLTIVDPTSRHKALVPELTLLVEMVDQEMGLLSGEISLIFCDNELIQQLNEEYRGKQGPTDVLTFTYYCDPSIKPEDRESPEEGSFLGEIYLSEEKALQQAEERMLDEQKNWSYEMELYTLFIHSLLHLRGYDHEEDEDFRVMNVFEKKIMNQFLERKKS